LDIFERPWRLLTPSPPFLTHTRRDGVDKTETQLYISESKQEGEKHQFQRE
jgi:hypothetical protein